jgi:hypothetical protein
VTLWKTPRIYMNNNQFIDPVPGNVYQSLGHGLNPSRITYQKGERDQKVEAPNQEPKSIH